MTRETKTSNGSNREIGTVLYNICINAGGGVSYYKETSQELKESRLELSPGPGKTRQPTLTRHRPIPTRQQSGRQPGNRTRPKSRGLQAKPAETGGALAPPVDVAHRDTHTRAHTPTLSCGRSEMRILEWYFDALWFTICVITHFKEYDFSFMRSQIALYFRLYGILYKNDLCKI